MENSENGKSAVIDVLRAQITESISHVRKNREINKQRATFVRVFAILSSGMVTVLIGWDGGAKEQLLNSLALAFSAFVTMLTALEPFFNYRSLWIEHEKALASFHRLKGRVEIEIANTKNDEQSVTDFVKEYEEIWEELSRNWINHRLSDKNNNFRLHDEE